MLKIATFAKPQTVNCYFKLGRIYQSSHREHDFAWILRHCKDLEEKAKRQKDVSKILYCALELRNCLEMVEFYFLLASVDPKLHLTIKEIASQWKGNEKANKKIKALNFKAQKFQELASESSDISTTLFSYKKCDELKNKLSKYLHTYTLTEDEIKYNSTFIQEAFKIFNETRNWIEKWLLFDGKTYTIASIRWDSLKPEQKKLFERWKDDLLNEEQLKEELKRIKNNS